jgi:uncharacterized protein YjbI with pentapeptide repeats
MFTLLRRLLDFIAAVITGALSFGWKAVSWIPRRWAETILALAVFGLAAYLVVQRTDDTERTVALVALGALLLILSLWRIPYWQAEIAQARPDKTKSQFEQENEARKTLAEAVSGLLLVVGLAATWLQLADDREARQSTSAQAEAGQVLTRQGQFTDRFTKAVDQLGSDKLRVRVGAIHALDQLAQDSEDYVPSVLEVLAAFVRERAPWPIPPGTPTPVPDNTGRVLPPADVQEALLVMGRGLWATPTPGTSTVVPTDQAATAAQLAMLGCINLSRTDLRGAKLGGSFPIPLCVDNANLGGASLYKVNLTRAYLWSTDLMGADLRGAHLTNANLSYAGFVGAYLRDADLTGADLTGADLTGAYLIGANLTDADLRAADLTRVRSGGITGEPASLPFGWSLVDGYLIGPNADLSFANLFRADLRGATLSGADLSYASLRGADLSDADLRDADLVRADLRGADLSSARHLTQAQIDSAITDSTTRLPPGMHLPTAQDVPAAASPMP